MAAVFRIKLNMSTFRNMVLESTRYPALEALKEGIIDGVGSVDETLAFVSEMKLTQKAQSQSYGKIKEELYREVIKDLDEAEGPSRNQAARDLDRNRRDLESKRRVDEYQNSLGQQRSKL
jgi:enoyl-CoA hydratase/carnithine racemase